MKRTKLKKISDTRRALLEEKPEGNPLHKWFLELWDIREDNRGIINCFETGKELQRRFYRENTVCYSHILPKELYAEYEYKEWNVKIVHPAAHSQYEIFPEKAPKQLAEYEKLIKLHEKGEL